MLFLGYAEKGTVEKMKEALRHFPDLTYAVDEVGDCEG